jgi:hypothetical protein
MWFVSKKKYNALLEQRNNYERIAYEAVQQNSRLLEEVAKLNELNQQINETDKGLVELNDALIVELDGLKEKLKFVIKQRDYYYDLLESTSEVEEKDE